MTPDICIYHGNCQDGFGAAWAVWKRFGDAVQYVPGIYGQPAPDVAGKNVVMVDFSYKYDVLAEMSWKARRIVILDHHKSAAEDLARLVSFDGTEAGIEVAVREGCWTQNIPEIVACFDMERSGASMAWDCYHPGKPRPTLIDVIEDRDLWRFRLPFTRAVSGCVFSHPYDFKTYDWLVNRADAALPLQEMMVEGDAIERKLQKDVAELLGVMTRRMVIGGVSVPVANLPYTMASEAAGKLAEGEPFAACYFDGPEARTFSLRSRKGGADVSEIAKRYGGGGHAGAAGFRVPIGWEGDPA